jgi:hypothetical protein
MNVLYNSCGIKGAFDVMLVHEMGADDINEKLRLLPR